MLTAPPAAIARRRAARPARGVGLSIALVLAACAGEYERDDVPLRTGDRDARLDAALVEDLGVDAALDLGADATPDADLPARALWLVLRDDDPATGVRGQLDPPHRPSGPDPLTALPDAALLVWWPGPGAAAPLEEAWRDPTRAAAPIWALGDRLGALDDPADARAVATADASWLGARLPDAARPLRRSALDPPALDPAATDEVDPLLVLVDADWTDPLAEVALVAARDRVEALAIPVAWGAIVDPSRPTVPAMVEVVAPACAVGDPAARARLRTAALDAGRRWLPCASPPINARLDDPAAAAEAPDPQALERALILARRDGAAAVAVDGVGGWRDDRQLDPVEGPPTAAPFALTTALLYRAYGIGRIAVVHGTLRRPAGPPPTRLAAPPRLVELVRTGGLSVEQLDADAEGLRLVLRDQGGGGRYELLLDDRPWRMPPDATLRYRRTDPALTIDLVFADGARLLDALPAPAGGPEVEVRLAPFVGQRVEEVTLVYRGGAERLDARLDRLRLVTGR